MPYYVYASATGSKLQPSLRNLYGLLMMRKFAREYESRSYLGRQGFC